MTRLLIAALILSCGAVHAHSADAGTIDAHEQRALVPPPLRFGELQLKVGDRVDYELSSPARKEKATVRAAVVGSAKVGTGELFQVEFDFKTTPHTLLVVWVLTSSKEPPYVERAAVVINHGTPVGVPVKSFIDPLRGAVTSTTKKSLTGRYAGEASAVQFKDGASATRSKKVPSFGVVEATTVEGTWTATAHGTDGKPTLKGLPLQIPEEFVR